MTKAELLEELADVPDDGSIMIDVGPGIVFPVDFSVRTWSGETGTALLVPDELWEA